MHNSSEGWGINNDKELIQFPINTNIDETKFLEKLSRFLDYNKNHFSGKISISNLCLAFSQTGDTRKKSAFINLLIKYYNNPRLGEKHYFKNMLESDAESLAEDFHNCQNNHAGYNNLYANLKRLKKTPFFVSRFFIIPGLLLIPPNGLLFFRFN